MSDGYIADSGQLDGEPAAAPVVEPVAEPTPAGPEPTIVQPDDTFTTLDPATLSPELQEVYKSMQGDYTKKLQANSEQRKELEQFSGIRESFNADPQGTIRKLAEQYGIPLAQAAAAVNEAQGNNPDEPQTWENVYQTAEDRAYDRIKQEMGPMADNMRKLQAASVETQLDGIDPMWRRHEESMQANLKTHPTLANDIPLLYEMAIPKAERDSRATQAALAKMRNLEKSGAVSGKTTTRSAPAGAAVSSFDDAVTEAKRLIAERG